MAKAILNIPDISSDDAEQTIRGALAPVEGIRNVEVDVAARRVEVEYDEQVVDLNRVRGILADEAYRVDSIDPWPAPGHAPLPPRPAQ
jgi:copper chaperone CopZ